MGGCVVWTDAPECIRIHLCLLVPHCTDTPIYIFPVTLSLSEITKKFPPKNTSDNLVSILFLQSHRDQTVGDVNDIDPFSTLRWRCFFWFLIKFMTQSTKPFCQLTTDFSGWLFLKKDPVFVRGLYRSYFKRGSKIYQTCWGNEKNTKPF
jgi:hypothetical protein